MLKLPNVNTGRNYLKSFFSIGLIQGGFMLFNYLAQLILANYLSAEDFGKITYYLSLINFFVVVILLGRNSYLSRELIRLAVTGQFSRIRKILKTDVLKVVLAWLVCSVLIFAAIKTELIRFDLRAFGVLSVIVLLIGAGSYRQGIQRAFGQIRMSQLPEKTLFSIFYLSVLTAFIYGTDLELSVIEILLIIAGAHVASQLIGYFLFRAFPLTIPHSDKGTKSKKKQGSTLLYVISVLDILDSNLDYYLLEFFSNYESLAVYSVSKRLSLLTFTVIYVSSYVIGPEISKLYYSGKIKELELQIKKTIRLNMLLATVITAVLFLLKDPLLNLFGEFYAAETGTALYAVLLAAQWFNVSLGIPALVLASTGKEKFILYVLIATVIIQIIGGYFAITLFGTTGMAVLFLISSLLWNGSLHIIVNKQLKIKIL